MIDRAAWEFMKFLLSPEQMAADFAAAEEFPAAKDLLTDDDLHRDDGQPGAAGSLDGRIRPTGIHLRHELAV